VRMRQKVDGMKQKRVRRPGIEPGASRWQRDILPLNQRRALITSRTLHILHPRTHAIYSQHTQIHNTHNELHTHTHAYTSNRHSCSRYTNNIYSPYADTHLVYNTHASNDTRRLCDLQNEPHTLHAVNYKTARITRKQRYYDKACIFVKNVQYMSWHNSQEQHKTTRK
jgi:hypothetical protein